MTSSTPENGVVVTSYTVMPEWLDYNNHMNVAYYVGTFDLGIDALKAIYGIDADYIKSARHLVSKTIFLQEVLRSAPNFLLFLETDSFNCCSMFLMFAISHLNKDQYIALACN